MGSRYLLFGLLVLFSASAQALTKYSEHIDRLQATFGNVSKENKIIYLDRDRVRRELARHESTDKNVRRNQVIANFVHERSGVKLDANAADTIGDFFSAGGNMALTFTLAGSGEKICVVVPSEPNLNAQQEAHRFIGWDKFNELQEFKGHVAKAELTKEEFALLADVHETFHCLDTVYAPLRDTGQYERDEIVHRGESFAEVGALLYLATQGRKHLTMPRLLYRMIGSFMVGRYGERSGASFSDLSWGTIYSFYPALLATQAAINEGLEGENLQEIIELAYRIVADRSLTKYDFHAITQYQKAPVSLGKMISDKKNDSNQEMRERTLKIEQSLVNYRLVLDAAFAVILPLVGGGELNDKTEKQLAVSNRITAGCPAAAAHDEDSYFNELQRLRDLHYKSSTAKASPLYELLVKMPHCAVPTEKRNSASIFRMAGI